MKSKSKEEIKKTVREFYGKNSKEKKIRCGYCCDSTAEQHLNAYEHFGYKIEDVKEYYSDRNIGLSCGNPIPVASIKKGETVLDLGSGNGFDCFISAKITGEAGFVIGVDMTPELIEQARNNIKKQGIENVEYRLGEIENIPVADNFVDVVISNCVINLSPDKQRVFSEIYRVLKPGGRLAIADIIAEKELPDCIKNDETMYCNCIGGTATVKELESWLKNAGFDNIKFERVTDSRRCIEEWIPEKGAVEYVVSAIIKAKKLR